MSYGLEREKKHGSFEYHWKSKVVRNETGLKDTVLVIKMPISANTTIQLLYNSLRKIKYKNFIILLCISIAHP